MNTQFLSPVTRPGIEIEFYQQPSSDQLQRLDAELKRRNPCLNQKSH